jgi:hypothetical protein
MLATADCPVHPEAFAVGVMMIQVSFIMGTMGVEPFTLKVTMGGKLSKIELNLDRVWFQSAWKSALVMHRAWKQHNAIPDSEGSQRTAFFF